MSGAVLGPRPGADSRVWISEAVVNDISVDPANGVFADVTYLPDGPDDHVRVGGPYACGGGGFWGPLHVNDTVLVAVPMGDTGHGPYIIARAWNSGDVPPTELRGAPQADTDPQQYDPPPDVWVRAEVGRDVRVKVSGGGNVKIEVADGGNVTLVVAGGVVRLGGDALTPTQGVVQGEAIDTFTGATQFVLGNASSKVLARKS